MNGNGKITSDDVSGSSVCSADVSQIAAPTEASARDAPEISGWCNGYG